MLLVKTNLEECKNSTDDDDDDDDDDDAEDSIESNALKKTLKNVKMLAGIAADEDWMIE
jgi:hypothetical protein